MSGAFLVASVLSLTALQSFAQAALDLPVGAKPKASPPFASPAFKVKASNGYELYVSSIRDLQLVLVTVLDKGPRFGELKGALYSASGKVGSHTIRARIGRLGLIDVRFHSTGGSRAYRPWCGGRAVSVLSGYYAGTIDFRGEGGFTAASSSRGQEDPGFQLQAACGRREIGSGPPSSPGAYLNVSLDGEPTPSFQAFKEAPGSLAYFLARLDGGSEASRGLGVSKFVEIPAASKSFNYSADLSAATVDPPAPFSGTGSYDSRATRKFSGSITVDFPGRPNFPLTRPSHGDASLVPGRWIQAG